MSTSSWCSLALLWQILSDAGFPNQFFCDSWAVGFWRADQWFILRRAARAARRCDTPDLEHYASSVNVHVGFIERSYLIPTIPNPSSHPTTTAGCARLRAPHSSFANVYSGRDCRDAARAARQHYATSSAQSRRMVAIELERAVQAAMADPLELVSFGNCNFFEQLGGTRS